ncbi:hypothetical protein JG687_00001860 [Phytophthora cactorum]|uniref:Uncharacterized protein n=1 Tax=Phytophthora cactorum TaxID=29920 RepID=A0A8T1UZZ2_9STRA|nr:hypothetical protein PC120_g15287 [Phytophthora cactorum]KAG3202800.1 hypothetical protein PC128_g2943 [Phytophthora cactorum]KAG4048714.1 hypothetical protein PC123_g15973 [Phytophthora cactorum]KAG6971746.1 hypothetical protein JG687_00001860 [Phytophthora cactorum]
MVDACSRSALVARQVVNALSTVCCFASRKHRERDKLKTLRGTRSARDSATELHWGVSAAEDEDDNGPGSGDEDVLTSLGASYRAWRVYHREKRAHDYTKSRLVAAIRREAGLVKLLARIGGTAEDVECTLMRLEDLEATVVALEEKYDGQVTREDLALELEALQAQCQVHSDRLYEANAAALHWKSQYQDVLSQLVASNLEKERLDGELRKVKKAAVLAMNRQYVQLDTNGASQLLLRTTRHYENESKKRSYSSDEIL